MSMPFEMVTDSGRLRSPRVFITSWIVGVAAIVLLWLVMSVVVGDPSRVPAPSTVFHLLATSVAIYSEIAGRTAMLSALGLVVATVCAAAVVVAVAVRPRLEPLIYPYIVMLKATPAVAFAPLLNLALHSGPQVKVIIAAMISFFPMVVGGIDGLARVPDTLRTLADAYGCRPWARFRRIGGGYAVSRFLSGMKTSAPLCVVGAIVGEFVDATAAGKSGVGTYIASHARDLYMDHVFAGVCVATALGMSFFAVASGASAAAERMLHLGK